jgi:cyclopropane fatty-acyl-phospholipid synthase-like methyltransferase
MACMAILSQTSLAMLVTAESCERNKGPILEVLRGELGGARTLLEIGSGTGQHAVYCAAHLPHLSWQPSEVAALLPALAERVRLEGGANLKAPLALDVRSPSWPCAPVDAIFTANTLHIVGLDAVADFFRGAGATLKPAGVLCVYGPFNYRGSYTSASNAQFDAWLKSRDAASGIRDFEALDALARAAGLILSADHAMPANNRTLVWRRPPGTS